MVQNWIVDRSTARDFYKTIGMSAELSLVQDGANTVNPEKIQGATMPYG